MKITAKDTNRLEIRLASSDDREVIYRLRHEVYARELGQHPARDGGVLKDDLDEFNTYLVAARPGRIEGFISITPPGFGKYSLHKYLSPAEISPKADGRTFEVRLLTVLRPHRGRSLAPLLMYAALRWVHTHGGTRIIGMGRREIMKLYRKLGIDPSGRIIQSGAAAFELMTAEVEQLRKAATRNKELLERQSRVIDWQLPFPFWEPVGCFHGGAFFEAIGTGFEHLERRHEIINADVLDAWFPPSPKVLAALRADLGWLLKTSPPADAGGLKHAIARARGVAPENILPGAGSSDLIFLALRHWLKPASRVLILDPTYGEYAHVLEKVIRCRVDRLPLERNRNYTVDVTELAKRRDFDLVVLVNPNSPTGQHVPREALEAWLRQLPPASRAWVDETYIEYAGPGQSLEGFAAASANVVVCKSMSKVYALSGARVGYLCGSSRTVEELQALTPPWSVSLPAQVAAVRALEDPAYYERRLAETRLLREQLAVDLSGLDGWQVMPGTANFLLCHPPEDGPEAAEIIRRCRLRGLFLRDAGAMSARPQKHALRIAVKDAETNRRMVEILKEALAERAG